MAGDGRSKKQEDTSDLSSPSSSYQTAAQTITGIVSNAVENLPDETKKTIKTMFFFVGQPPGIRLVMERIIGRRRCSFASTVLGGSY